MSEVDSAKLLLFAATAIALFSGVYWLFYALAILLLCIVFAEAPATPAKAPKAAAKASEAPVVIQSASDNGAMQLYNEILSSVIKDALESNRK